MNRAALVLFTTEVPGRTQGWWKQFDTLIAPAELAPVARSRSLSFEALEDFVDPGNIQDAAALLGKLARATLPDGTRVSKSVVYKGYELWWFHYDELYLRHCLPYTQYRRLLERLLAFQNVSVYGSPAPVLFYFFLSAHNRTCTFLDKWGTIPSAGIWLQFLLSILSWPFLMFTRPGILLYTGDLFDPPRDHSFRMRFIYDELRARKLPFVEFIRSLEPFLVVFSHALTRRRPVIYSYAIKVIFSWVANFFGEKKFNVGSDNPEQTFIRSLATHYLRNTRGVVWSIEVLHFLMRSIGTRAALIPAASSRTFHEVIACRLAGIPSVGVLHGVASRFYNVYDFMPEYDGEKHLGLDVYGLWSTWWRDYYLAHGRVYSPAHLAVSGPFRPLSGEAVGHAPPPSRPLKVLFVAEQLAEPLEILPYLEALMAANSLELFYKFRPYRDGFEEWLKEHRPDVLARMDSARIMRGTMVEAIAQADVVVGSHSTAVLEALLQMKPPVFFHTRKWGDYFDLEPFNADYGIFAKNPAQLIEYISQSINMPSETLKALQERFFGDPSKNGSAWAVDELEKHL